MSRESLVYFTFNFNILIFCYKTKLTWCFILYLFLFIALPTILDLGIAFTMSPVATLPVLNAQKDFVRNLLQTFTISSSDTRVGFMKYGRDSKLVFRLDSIMSDQSINQAISEVASEDPGYNLLSLLKLAGNQFFQQGYGGRPGVAKSLLIFNNGRSGISIDDLQTEANKLRDMGVKIVVVGISQNVDQSETVSYTHLTLPTKA